jgi:hypothetical protein
MPCSNAKSESRFRADDPAFRRYLARGLGPGDTGQIDQQILEKSPFLPVSEDDF